MLMNIIRRIRLSQLLRTFIYFALLYFITFCIVFPKLLSNLGYSKLFESIGKTEELVNFNLERNKLAIRYFDNLKKDDVQVVNPHKTPSIAIVIASTRRTGKHVRYVLQTTARIMQEMTNDEPHVIDLTLVNSNDPPEKHVDALFLSSFIKVVNNTKNHRIDNYLHKQCEDMLTALKYGMEANSDYIVVFEDDALPVRGFFKRLTYLVNKQLLGVEKLGLVKLYYPDKWSGYQKDKLIELLCMSIFFGFILTGVTIALTKKLSVTLSIDSMLIFFGLYALYIALAAYLIGRVHLVEVLRHYLPLYQTLINCPRCCTPAILYTKQFAEILQKEMKCRQSYPMDFVLDDAVKSSGMRQYLLFPNLVTHMGYYSGLSFKVNNPGEHYFLYPV